MYQQIFIVFVFIIKFVYSDSFSSLIDLPLTINSGNYIIHATLTESNSSEKFFIQEYISSTENLIRGKISISSDKIGSIDVHYSTGSSKIQRLVIHDNQCELLSYKNTSKWGTKLSGVSNQLTSDILLLGPSLIYRLKHSPLSFSWNEYRYTTIRGITTKSIQTILPDRISIEALYKKNLDIEARITQPTRLVISNTLNYFKFLQNEVTLDFYLQTETNEELDKIVTPKTGIGCPNYLTDGLDKQYSAVPLIGAGQLHYISIENVNGPQQTSIRNQYFADSKYQLMYLETTTGGVTKYQIYDYTLGVIYENIGSGYCTYSAIQSDSPGVSYNRKFSLSDLFETDSYFKYVGQINYEKRSGFQVDVWEALEYSYKKVTYDKVVKTLYFVKSLDPESIYGYTPIGATINLYNKKSSGDYSLIGSIDKVFYEFGLIDGAEEYENRFKVSDCYPAAEQQKTLELHFSCNSSSCGYFAKKKFYDFRDSIRKALLDTEIISASRISDVDLTFYDNDTVALVTFLSAPSARNIFKPTTIYLSKASLSNAKTEFSLNSDACLQTNSYKADLYEALAYCDKTNICAKIESFDSIVEDKENGTQCKVYQFPLLNFYRFSRETSLDKLQEQLLRQKVTFRFIGFPIGGSIAFAEYKLSQVMDVTEKQEDVKQLYVINRAASKLAEDYTDAILVENIATFGDCYRACENSDDASCEAFSFCQYPDRVECLVSPTNYENISTDVMPYDAACNVYSVNHINDYIEIPNKQFKATPDIWTKEWQYGCANLCYNSRECKSFQFCSGKCSFGGTYTASSVQYSETCNIYIPKVSHLYSVTSRKLVTETFHTEYNLNFEQCANLCNDWRYTNETCVSFNYCQKTKSASSCSLSSLSVKDPTTKSTESNICKNYQQSDEVSRKNNNLKQANSQIVNEGTSGGEAFGIIILFITIGLVVGLGTPFIYKKTKSVLKVTKSSSTNDTFTWTRQVDVNDDQHSVI